MRDIALYIICIALVALLIHLHTAYPEAPPTATPVSYYDWKGQYKGSLLYDSIHRYPDSTVYFYKGRTIVEPACTYIYLPDLNEH